MKLRSAKFKTSLRTRVALGVSLPIFIILALLSLFHYSRKIQLINEQTRLHAAQLGEMMIRSLKHAMISKGGDHLDASLTDVGNLDDVEQIRIIGISGIVLSDSKGELQDQIFDLEDDECQACHQFPKTEMPRAIAFPHEREGLRVSTPINNSDQCSECHNEEASHLGVLLMDISFSEQQEDYLRDLKFDLVILVLSTIFVSLGSFNIIQRLVVHRVENLTKPIAEYANGNFSVRIKNGSKVEDELSILVDTVNRMSEELEQHTKREFERQQLRENAIIQERERIARELHDGLAQVLGFVNTKAMAVRLMLENNQFKEAGNQLHQLEEAARGVFVDVREAILGLKMSGNVDKGLVPALEEYLTQFTELSGIHAGLAISSMGDNLGLSFEIELHLFRIVQEALTNVRRHSQATEVLVKISQDDNSVKLMIEDNGIGFDYGSLKPENGDHFGLIAMRERSLEIGANLVIRADIGVGTQILVELTNNGN